ncbi:MAG: hypothetical protein WCQ95_06905 [Bacteroidota bacterium]
MKRLLLVLLVAAIAIPTFQSCKKGPNDPAISLKSRKARLVGEWTLSSGTITQNAGTQVVYTFNGSTVSYSTGGSVNYTETVTIVKDGTYKSVVLDDGDMSTDEGQWYFMGANKDNDIKNKECVAFVITKRTYTPAGGTTIVSTWTSTNPDFAWRLDELKSKELIVTIDETSSSPSSTTGTYTFTKK